MVLQAVTQQLWDAAITAYHQMNNPDGLYEAWTWMKDQAHDWVPSQHSAYTALVLAVTAMHSNPLQGVLTIRPDTLDTTLTCDLLRDLSGASAKRDNSIQHH